MVTGLLSGREVAHHGRHYDVEARFLPVQPGGEGCRSGWRPGGRTAASSSARCATTGLPHRYRCSGGHRRDRPAGAHLGRPFDVVVQGWPGSGVDGWAAAAATWWLAQFDPFTATADHVESVIADGPR